MREHILLRRREAYNMAATSPLPQLWARCGESPHLALVNKLMLTTHISIPYILLIYLKPLVEYVTVHFASHFSKEHQTIYADPHVAKRKAQYVSAKVFPSKRQINITFSSGFFGLATCKSHRRMI